jgi:Transglycosylase SLT domain/D-alanyl-D-alanine carboxypeptidase
MSAAPAQARMASLADPPEDRRLVLATSLGEAKGGLAIAAAVAVILSHQHDSVLLVELDSRARRAPTLLAAASARELEDALRDEDFDRVAARGRLCWLGLDSDAKALDELARAVDMVPDRGVSVAYLPAALWQPALERFPTPAGAMLRADLPQDRSLAALSVIELRARRVSARVASRPLGRVATRRVLAGLDPGGTASRRVERLGRGLAPRATRRGPRSELFAQLAVPESQRGQALMLVLAAAFVILFCAAVLTAIGGAVTGASRTQRAADLAALSGARSLRDDFERLFIPARLPSGSPNPRHLTKDEYLRRALAAARAAAVRNGVGSDRLRVTFPDRETFAPTLVKAWVTASVDARALPGAGRTSSGGSSAVTIEASAKAEASPPAAATGPAPTMASGGGYSGPLVYRQGKPMRPDVAAAFDRMAAAAQRDGITLIINSAYRSDAEQARLWEQNPDPRWVAPPGTSLHRCATELDLGPPSAYGWLAAHAGRFGFTKRYSWEPWHFGYDGGPAPCSEAGDHVGMTPAGRGEPQPAGGLPSFVPERYREPILRAAARWSVSANLLAAQLLAESNFNPFAVSPAGAQGIAQFMPATAAQYGLDDPFDAPAAIDAQAHLMSDLLRRFGGSISLALAAYNAGPGAVEACGCVPDIPETQAYVARILGLMGGAGELVTPTLEVRLVA